MQRRKGYSYVQGSGDDHETWSLGLTPRLFWQNKDEILGAGKDGCDTAVQQVVARSKKLGGGTIMGSLTVPVAGAEDISFTKLGPTNLHLGNLFAGQTVHHTVSFQFLSSNHDDVFFVETAFPPKCWSSFDVILNCSNITLPGHELQVQSQEQQSHAGASRYLELGISSGKKGRFQLLKLLQNADEFLHAALKQNQRVLICCENGHDVSVVVAISILAKYFTENGEFSKSERPQIAITKQLIRKRLHFILKYRHMASPLRSLMRMLNSHLMSTQVGKGGGDSDDNDEEEGSQGAEGGP